MKTKEFLSLLKENTDKSLLFEYKDGHFVGANYHITEVRNITVDAVDCGANTNFWKETVIQLWESPKAKDKTDYMAVDKALSILNKVDKMKPMEKEVEVKFEYSNHNFHTAQLFVHGHTIENDKIIMRLGVEHTNCKAIGTLGAPEEKKLKVGACCTPEVGCC